MFHLFIALVAAADPKAEYAEAIEVTNHQNILPRDPLSDLTKIAKDGKLTLSTWSHHEVHSGPQAHTTWFTIPEDFTSNMIDAIDKMSFEDDVNTQLKNR